MGFRVAVIAFIYESNTFSLLQTGMDDFHATQYFVGEEVFKEFENTGSEIGGCIDVARQKGWQADYILAAHAQPGGPVLEKAFAHIGDECVRRLKEGGPYDGVFVALHGAMVTATDQDGDSQFLRVVRDVVGNDIPLAITLDLHANIFDEMSELADIAVSFRTYPHVDMREIGVESSLLLHRAMKGEIAPRLSTARPEMLVGCDDGRTADAGPMCRLLETAAREAEISGILNVAINAGFTDADVWASGPSVLVTWDALVADVECARRAANRVCAQIWSFRDVWHAPISLQECLAKLVVVSAQSGPIVIADYADNPGAGAYSDCTAILSGLLEMGVGDVAVGALYDPQAVEVLAAQGVGATVSISIGGKVDPLIGGGPLQVVGKVMAVSAGDFVYEGPMFRGLSATTGMGVCLRVEGIDIMIVSNRTQMLDKNIFRLVGIEPTEKAIVVVKSQNHFKAAFGPIASEIIITDGGGLCSPDVSLRTYERLRRPIFPLDEIGELEF